MATASDVEELAVLVICQEDPARTRHYQFPTSASAADVLRRWAADVGVPAEAAVLRAMDGTAVEPRQALGGMGEVAPGARLVNLWVEESASVSVSLYGAAPEEGVRVAARLSAPPRALEASVRAALRLPGGMSFRLRTPAGPLLSGVALCEQGVAAGGALQAEPALDVSVRELWSGREERVLLFASDACRLLAAGVAAPYRLTSGRRRVDAALQAGQALRVLGALRGGHCRLRLEVAQDAALAIGRQLRSALVWPRSSAAELLRASSAPPGGVQFAGAMVPLAARLCRVDLPAGSLLHWRPIAVTVRSSTGRRLVAHVPDGSTVADVKEAVREKEEETNFVLLRAGRELTDEDCVHAGDDLRALSAALTLTVELEEVWLRWTTTRRALTFSDVMRTAAAICHMQRASLVGRTLCCAGCGRALNKAEEAFQAIPSACCRVRSLSLREPSTRDAASQSASAARAELAKVKPPETRSRGVQAVIFRHDEATQTERAVAGPRVLRTATQTERARSAFGQQQPRWPLRPFVISDWTGKRRLVWCSLPLPDAATVGEVRAAVAQEVGLEPARVRLSRWVSSRRGKYVFLVCGADGDLPGSPQECDYGAADGTVQRFRLQVDSCHQLNLDRDDAPFVLVPGRRNCVRAHRR